MKLKLDSYEKKIEDSAETYKPVSKQSLKEIEGRLDQIRKTRNINIRISEVDLEALRKRSQEEGIPYQTLISSILHKFITNQLVDENAIRKSMRLLSSH